MLFAQTASWILHSVVDLVSYCPGDESMLLSCHDQNLGVYPDVAFIEPCLQPMTHLCSGTMQMLHIPDCGFIWIFPGMYELLALIHQRVTFGFPADIGLQALFFLAHNMFVAVQTPSSFLSAGV